MWDVQQPNQSDCNLFFIWQLQAGTCDLHSKKIVSKFEICLTINQSKVQDVQK